MNINQIRHSDPIQYLFSLFIWLGLEVLVWNVFSAEKILENFPQSKNRIEKAIHIICGILSFVLSVLICVIVEEKTGINVID